MWLGCSKDVKIFLCVINNSLIPTCGLIKSIGIAELNTYAQNYCLFDEILIVYEIPYFLLSFKINCVCAPTWFQGVLGGFWHFLNYCLRKYCSIFFFYFRGDKLLQILKNCLNILWNDISNGFNISIFPVFPKNVIIMYININIYIYASKKCGERF